MSAPEIAEEMNIPVYRVRQNLKDRGISLQGGKRNEMALYLDQIRDGVDKGFTLREIAEVIGKPYSTVVRWSAMSGIASDPNKAKKEEAIKLHIEENKTIKEIAEFSNFDTDKKED